MCMYVFLSVCVWMYERCEYVQNIIRAAHVRCAVCICIHCIDIYEHRILCHILCAISLLTLLGVCSIHIQMIECFAILHARRNDSVCTFLSNSPHVSILSIHVIFMHAVKMLDARIHK